MHHRILKKHQFYGGHEIVVAQHCFLQQSVQLVPFGYRHVLGFADALSKVAVDVGFLAHDCLVHFLRAKFSLYIFQGLYLIIFPRSLHSF